MRSCGYDAHLQSQMTAYENSFCYGEPSEKCEGCDDSNCEHHPAYDGCDCHKYKNCYCEICNPRQYEKDITAT